MPVGRSLTPLLPPVCPACRGSSGELGGVNALSPSLGRQLARPVLQAACLTACLTGWLAALAGDSGEDQVAGSGESAARVAIGLHDGAD
jgi:hypothetical protein